MFEIRVERDGPLFSKISIGNLIIITSYQNFDLAKNITNLVLIKKQDYKYGTVFKEFAITIKGLIKDA